MCPKLCSAAIEFLFSYIFLIQASDSWGLEFFQFRWITGIWIFLFLVLILAFDKTHWIRYCTRFTEEILHVLVALLFMYEGFKNLGKVSFERVQILFIVFINLKIENLFLVFISNTHFWSS